MINLNDAVTLLRTKREELLRELDAIEKALAALGSVEIVLAPPSTESSLAAPEAPSAVPTTTRLKPARMLSDEHKQALNEGRRKARHSKNAAAGLAREISDSPPALAAVAGADGRQPRLVKQIKR